MANPALYERDSFRTDRCTGGPIAVHAFRSRCLLTRFSGEECEYPQTLRPFLLTWPPHSS